MFGDQPLLSISNRICEENENISDVTSLQYFGPEAGDSSPPSFAPWPPDSTSGEMGLCQMSEQQFGDADLGNVLSNQQCEKLHEELALKERELTVLREEVLKSSEELEEARSR